MARKSFTVELILDVRAKDEGDAERIGREAARAALGVGLVDGALVSDVREGDDSGDERQPSEGDA